MEGHIHGIFWGAFTSYPSSFEHQRLRQLNRLWGPWEGLKKQ